MCVQSAASHDGIVGHPGMVPRETAVLTATLHTAFPMVGTIVDAHAAVESEKSLAVITVNELRSFSTRFLYNVYSMAESATYTARAESATSRTMRNSRKDTDETNSAVARAELIISIAR